MKIAELLELVECWIAREEEHGFGKRRGIGNLDLDELLGLGLLLLARLLRLTLFLPFLLLFLLVALS